MSIKTINPATGVTEKEFEKYSNEFVSQIIQDVYQESINWKATSIDKRKQLLTNVAVVLTEKKEEFAAILTTEMGKPIKQAIAEVEKCAWVCNYYAENAENILKEEVIPTDATESFVRFDPLGIILAVMPWNFPFWQVFRFAAPALMAGNVCLLKHASNVPQSALAIEHIFRIACFPQNCFRTLLIDASQTEAVLNNPLVKAATLTGSENAGKSVAKACGNKLKKTVMELGGSDPFIILADADLKLAASTAATARLLNNGQSCIAAKRFIVVKDVYPEFVKLFVENMKNVKVGDPMNYDTGLGPIARYDLLLELSEQVKASVQAGAEVLCGGNIIKRDGYYFESTVLAGIKKGMPAYSEEIFGPVASVIMAENDEDAIFIANDSDFGLGASLWTNDIDKAKMFAGLINSGSVFINGLVKSDPRLPFGGINLSGYGRELSHYGIKEFVNIKTVWIK